MRQLRIQTVIIIILLLQSSCVHRQQYHPSISKKPEMTAKQKRKKVLKTAKSLLSKRSIVVNNKKYPYDCSGFVHAVYDSAGINLYADLRKYPKLNGVRIIYRYCGDHGSIERGRTAKPGDIIFFNNTYDKDRDKKYDDKLTHIAVIEKVSGDKTITFIHHSSVGIIRDKMNLAHPDKYLKKNSKKVINSYLRRRSKSDKRLSLLAGQLFTGFGVVIK